MDLRVHMKEKSGTTMPSAPMFEPIGLGYMLGEKYRHCRPRLETWQKFELGAKNILALGHGRHRLTKENLIPVTCLLGHVAQFVREGSVLRNGGNMPL